MLTVRNAFLGLLALAIVIGSARYFETRAAVKRTQADTGAPVHVAPVERCDVPVVVHALGTVLANAFVNVSPRVQGALESADFQEGQFVRKGQLLFQIDPRPFQANLAQASAMLLRDQAQLKNAHLC